MGVVAALTVKITANTSDFDKGLSKVEASWKRTGRQLQSIGSTLTQSVTLPLSLAGGAALKFSTDFETAMTKTVTLAGETKDSMLALRGSVLEISKETGIGPVALADALVAIESNGLSGKDALDVLTASAKGSAIGMGEAADIGRALTAVMNAYGESGLTASQAADQFHQTVLLGGAEADALAGELGRVVGVASQLGVSFAEVGAFIATYTRLGLSASEATSGLSGVLNTILSPSSEAKKALAEVGMSAGQLRQQVSEQGLGAALIGLIGKLHGNADATGALFGNVRALAGVLGTAGTQAAAYRDNLDKIKNSTGSLSAAFKVWEGTTAATWAKFTAGVQVAAIAIGDQLAPAFSRILQASMPLVDLVAKMATGFSQLPQPVQTVAIGLAAVAAAIGPVTYAIGSLFTAGGSLLGLLRMIPGATGVIGTAFAALSSPITVVIGLIGGAITAIHELTGSWTAGFAVMLPPVGALMQAWQRMTDYMDGHSPLEALRTLMGGVGQGPAVQSPKASINAPLGPAMDLKDAMDLLDHSGKNVADTFGKIGKAGVSAMKGTTAATKELIQATRAVSGDALLGAGWTGANGGLGSGMGSLGGLMAAYMGLQSNQNSVGTGFLGGSLGQYNSLQGLANQVGMGAGGSPTVESQNVSTQVAAYAREQLAETARATVDSIGEAFQFFTGSLSKGMAGLLGGLLNSLKRGAGDGSWVTKLFGGRAGQMIGNGLGAGMAGFGGGFSMGEEFGTGKGMLGGAASGALAGAAFGPIGAAIGGIAGLIGGIFGGRKKKKQEQAQMGEARSQLIEQFGGMDQLRNAATEAGVSVDLLFSTKKPAEFNAEMQKVTEAIKVMQERIKTTIGDIDKVMSKGDLIGADLWKNILKDKDADEIKAKLQEVFVTSVSRANDGFTKIAQNFELLKRPINEIGVLADAAFGGLLAAGASLPEAIAAMAPALEHLRELMGNSGEQAQGPLASLFTFQSAVENNKGIFELLSGVNDMIVGLGNSGLLTQQTFASLGATVSQAFGQLQANGVASTTALQLMQPELQKLWELEKQRGLTLDANTQSLIDQGVAQGIIGPQMQTTEQKMLDVMLAIAKVLGADIPTALLGLPGAAATAATGVNTALGAISRDIRVGVSADWQFSGHVDQPTGPTGGTGSKPISPRPMGMGGIVRSPTLALIGENGPEKVTPLDAEPRVAVHVTVNGTADRQFATILAREISLGGGLKTEWQGAMR